jgi:TRAP-type uncharacterized transport system substrate-binding protein
MAEPGTVHPPVTRSLIVLEMAHHLAAGRGIRQATAIVDLGDHKLGLFGSSTVQGINAVVAREVDLAIVNPSATLTLAHRGTGPFRTPLPLRTIAVIPSHDQYLFAVHPDTGLTSFAEIAARRPKLRIGVRGARDHSLHFMLDDIMRASGFSRDEIAAWGGEFRFEGGVPEPNSKKFRALVAGELDAIWDEGAPEWLVPALDAGMRLLSLSGDALRQLETSGYRRARIPQTRHPALTHDIDTVDFSGWPLFVHTDVPDDRVRAICEALAARVERVPWQEETPLTLARMVQNAADAPYDVPLHPAAERAWKERGLL